MIKIDCATKNSKRKRKKRTILIASIYVLHALQFRSNVVERIRLIAPHLVVRAR